MKKIFLLALLTISVSGFAQSNKDKSNAAYYKAEDQFKSGNYQSCIDRLNEAIELLGSSSVKIQYLKAKAYKKLENYSQVKIELGKYFGLKPDEDEKYKEMLSLSEETDALIKQKEETELLNKKKTEEAELLKKNDDAAWAAAILANTNIALDDYLYRFPSGKHATEAKTNLEKYYWNGAQNENTSTAYNNYIAKYPKGEYINQAKEESCYLKATSANSAGNYEEYCNTYPNGKYITEAKTFLGKEYYTTAENYYNKQDNENAKKYYVKYLILFPYGDKSTAIEEKLEKMKTEGTNIKNNKEYLRLNALADDLKKKANKESVKGTLWLLGGAGALGLGGCIVYQGYLLKDSYIHYIGGGALMFSGFVLGTAYTIVNFSFAKEHRQKSKDLRKQAKALSFNFNPTIYPLNNSYGLALRIKF